MLAVGYSMQWRSRTVCILVDWLAGIVDKRILDMFRLDGCEKLLIDSCLIALVSNMEMKNSPFRSICGFHFKQCDVRILWL